MSRLSLWIVVSAVVVCGCARNQAAQADGAVLRIGVGVGPSARGGLSVLTEMLYAEPLIALSADGKAVGRLAESWDWEDDWQTLRIVLRSGIKLHDDSVLDAKTAKVFLEAKMASLRREGYAGAFDRVAAIETPNDRTLVLKMSDRDAFLIPEFNNANLVDPQSPLTGTGPFKLVSKDPVQADRFDDYHRGAPAIHRVELRSYDSQRAAWAALMRSEVDAVQEVNRDSVEFLERTPNVQVFGSLRPYYWALSFNLHHPILRSPQVRRALSRAVNREEIVSRVFRGFGRPAVDPVWPLFWAYSESTDQYGYDPSSARRELQHVRVGGARNGRFAFSCLFYGEDPQVERMALMIQRQFADVGVELELQAAPLNEILNRIRSGNFDSFLLQSASGRALDWTYRFWHSPQLGHPALQPTGYSAADQALDELRLAFTDEQVRTGVRKLRRQFYSDPPAVFVAWQQATRVVSNRFDISNADLQDAFANVWQWKPRDGGR